MKKKLLALFVSVLFVLSAFASTAALAEEVVDAGYTYDAETDTYTITTADGYIAVVNLMNGTSPETANLDATIKLAADLDFTDKVVPALAPAVANGYFSGTFDGNGHTISNVKMEGTAARTALVSNGLACTFVNLTVTDSTFSGAAYTSVLLGDTPKNGEQKLDEVVSTGDVVTFENCHILRCSVTSSANYATFFATTGDNKILVKDCSALDSFIESKAKGGRAAFIAQDRGACTNIDVVNFVATGEAKAISGDGVAGIMGYVCGTTITMTNVYSDIDCGTAKWAGQFVPVNRYCNVIISNSICKGALLGHVYELGGSNYGDVILTNVAVVAEEGETAPIFGVDVAFKNTDRAALIIDGVVIDGDKDHEPEKDITDATAAAATWMAATVPTVKPADLVAKVRALMPNSINVRRAVVTLAGGEFDFAETNGYEYNSDTDTYTVYDADGLIKVVAEINAGNLDANVVLVADIDLNGKAYTPIAPGNNSATAGYTGTFDGQGHAIKNFTSSQTTNGGNGPGAGFIQLAGACTVKNVTFVNPVVEGVRGTAVVIAKTVGTKPEGEVEPQTVTIENCNIINGKASGAGKQSYIAGLIGEFKGWFSASIKNCVVDIDITTTGDYAGTLIGGESGADASSVFAVENVIATGTVTAGKGAGMLGYICDLNVEATNVVSFVKATATVSGSEKNVSSVVGYPKRTSVTLKNVLCTDAPIGYSELLGEKVLNIIKLENVHVLGTDAVSIFNNVKFSTADTAKGAQLIVDKADAVTDENSFKAATVSALSDGFAHAMIKTEIFADNAALRDAALALIPHEHVYDQEVPADEYLKTAATCTAVAVYKKSCACGDAGEETFEYGDKLPHAWVEVAGDEYLLNAATCTTPAEFYKHCEDCGLLSEETFSAIGALGHAWGDWAVITEPTIEAEGLKVRLCATCGGQDSVTLDKLPAPAPEPTPEPEAPVEEPSMIDQIKGKMGCGGSIGGASIIIMIAAAGAVIARKKKED